ncbi:transcriptional repressor [Flammeovirgaceae bacterium SG7u.111]|nr:transcriptional repressor [Flammeovirgaceae bacterium SG7u.132]WPO35762.1 transcriptional repressor [Flammeovirgaceae bacterium SG7u.111]
METVEILNSSSLRVTGNRLDILEIFKENSFALAESFLEEKLSGKCDRVTIYRTLKTFEDSGIIHRVLDENNIVKYALCGHGCHDSSEHSHDHVHFKCKTCGQTTCIDSVPIQKIKLPEGYAQEETFLLIVGECKTCKQ